MENIGVEAHAYLECSRSVRRPVRPGDEKVRSKGSWGTDHVGSR